MSDSDDKTKVPIKVCVGGTLGAALFITALIWGPWWIEGHRLKDNKGELVSSAGIIVTGFRTMIVAIVAGIFTALGLWYTRKKHELDQRQFEHSPAKVKSPVDTSRRSSYSPPKSSTNVLVASTVSNAS